MDFLLKTGAFDEAGRRFQEKDRFFAFESTPEGRRLKE